MNWFELCTAREGNGGVYYHLIKDSESPFQKTSGCINVSIGKINSRGKDFGG